MIILTLLFFLSFNANSQIEILNDNISYEFEILIKDLNQSNLTREDLKKVQGIDLYISRLNKKGRLFFYKNSIYKSILKNDIFSKTRKSLTYKEFLRTVSKFNESKKDYTLFSNWIIESILVELEKLNKATTSEEFTLISRDPEITKTMELTSNLILDFLNQKASEFKNSISKLAVEVLNNLYQDALIVSSTVVINLKDAKPSLKVVLKEEIKVSEEEKALKTKSDDDYLPTVDPSTAVDEIKIQEINDSKWKPKN